MFFVLCIWMVSTAFGFICSRYVSVIGFLISALVAALLLGFVISGRYSLSHFWIQLAAFVCLQVGYFIGIVWQALARSAAPIQSADKTLRDNGRNEQNIGLRLWFEIF